MMKRIRQKAILDLIRTQPIASQEELLENLQARKIEVSQSTLSRDIQELRLAKTGGIYSVMGHEPPRASDESIRRILREFLAAVEVAENLVVLKTGPGNTGVVSQAIDDAGWPEMVGSIAGENTIFIATRSQKDSRKLEQRILEYSK
jgi:transcriptional regulator of arginine metabolism